VCSQPILKYHHQLVLVLHLQLTTLQIGEYCNNIEYPFNFDL
jgi:hypothetical protein